MKERILQFIEYKMISKNKFYTETGLSNGILDKKSGLTMESVEKICNRFPEINLNWLVKGEGEMIVGTAITITQNGNTNAANNVSGKVRKIEQNVEYSNKELMEIIREKDKQIAEKDKQIDKLLDKISN